MPVLNPKALIDERISALRAYHRAAGVATAELDLSGGVDSAVMLGLLAFALGAKRVTAVHSILSTDPQATARAEAVAKAFAVDLVTIELSDLAQVLTRRMRAALVAAGHDPAALDARTAADPTILGSIRSTLRAPVGRGFNRLVGGGIRHGTGNECEDRWLRFYQKGGDGEVDTNPLAFLSKGEVYQLAVALGVPRSVIVATPSPDLWGIGAAHNDEAEIAAVLAVDPKPNRFYSYVDPSDGAYLSVGLVERLSRLLDAPFAGLTIADALFADHVNPARLEAVIGAAVGHRCFAGVDPVTTEAMVRGARRIEARTRHKLNPNCPTLGERPSLVAAGLLTDSLPVTSPTTSLALA